MTDRAALLAEAKRRGLVDQSALMAEAVRRGLMSELPPLTNAQRSAISEVPEVPIRAPDPEGRASNFGFSTKPGTAPPPVEDLARAAGIDLEGAAFDTRGAASFGEGLEGARRALENHFGVKVPVGEREELGGAITFINPETGRETLFNAPGLDVGDVAALAGDAVVFAPEAAAGIGATALGGLGAGVAGAGAGAAAGEFARRKIGQSIHVRDSGDDILGSLGAGAQAAALDAATLGAGRLGRAAINRAAGTRLPNVPSVGVPSGELAERLESAQRFGEEFRGQFGEDLPASVSRILSDDGIAGRQASAAEQTLLNRGAAPQLAAQRAQEERALNSAVGQMFPASTVDPSARLQQEAQRRVRATEDRINQRADEAADIVAERVGPLESPAAVGGEVRDALQQFRDAAMQRFGSRFDQIRDASGDLQVDLSGFKASARKIRETASADLFPSLSPESRRLLDEAVERSGDAVEYDVVVRGLSDLKAEQRAINAGRSATRDARSVSALIDELQSARDRALIGRPGLARQVEAVEQDYARFKRRIDGEIVGAILGRDRTGNFTVDEARIVSRLKSNPSQAARLAQTLRDPEFNVPAGSTSAIKNALVNDMRDALEGKSTKAQRTALRTYMKKNRDILAAFFDDMKPFENVGTALKKLENIQSSRDRILKRLNKTFDAKLANPDPEQVMARVWKGKSTNPADLRRLDNIASTDKTLKADFDLALKNNIRRSITATNAETPGELSVNGLRDIVQNSPLMEQVGRTLGADYARGLRVLEEAFRRSRGRKSDAAFLRDMEQSAAPSDLLQGVLRTVFRPLSREGVALTAALRLNSAGANKAMERVLANPELMLKLRKYNETRRDRDLRDFASAIGITAAVEAALEERDR